jgi:hypothetical protein
MEVSGQIHTLATIPPRKEPVVHLQWVVLCECRPVNTKLNSQRSLPCKGSIWEWQQAITKQHWLESRPLTVQPLLGYIEYVCSCYAVGAYFPSCCGDFFVNTNVTNKYDSCVTLKHSVLSSRTAKLAIRRVVRGRCRRLLPLHLN